MAELRVAVIWGISLSYSNQMCALQ